MEGKKNKEKEERIVESIWAYLKGNYAWIIYFRPFIVISIKVKVINSTLVLTV